MPAAFRQGVHAAYTLEAPPRSHKLAKDSLGPEDPRNWHPEVTKGSPACCPYPAGAQASSAPQAASGRLRPGTAPAGQGQAADNSQQHSDKKHSDKNAAGSLGLPPAALALQCRPTSAAATRLGEHRAACSTTCSTCAAEQTPPAALVLQCPSSDTLDAPHAGTRRLTPTRALNKPARLASAGTDKLTCVFVLSLCRRTVVGPRARCWLPVPGARPCRAWPSNRSEPHTATETDSGNGHSAGLAQRLPAKSMGLHW